MTTEIEKKIRDLQAEIRKHDELYEQNTPIISDGEYDALYRKLVDLETQYPELVTPDSPTQRLAMELVASLEKVPHTTPMLSLEKETKEAGVRKFFAKTSGGVIVQEKLDGLTVVLEYDGGKLVDAVTRGNGYIGERVLHTVKTIKTVPQTIAFTGHLKVRGEAIIPFSEFERINVDGEYSNVRNLASGTIRQLNASVAAKRGLGLLVYDVVEIDDIVFETDTARICFLADLGFWVVPGQHFTDVEELLRYIETMKDRRPNLPYAIDGLVLKANNLEERDELGTTSKYPKWAIAFKFEAAEATTTLRDVIWQVGRTGQITPVGVFDEVDIDGVEINRASLHNIEDIHRKDLRLGDRIVVARANDVIPQVTQAIKSERSGCEIVIQPLTVCPECGHEVRTSGPLTFCVNSACEPQKIGRLIHFASRDAMNIDGLGESLIETFVRRGWLETVADIYRLGEHAEEMEKLEGFGARKVTKLLAAIEASKAQSLAAFIYSLSITHAGRSVSKLLAKTYGHIENVMAASATELASLEGIGDIMAESIHSFFQEETNAQLIRDLIGFGLNVQEQQQADGDALKGLTFCITGTLSRGRDEIAAEIEKLGGKVSGSVSKKTSYLVMGDGAEGSGKHQKAIEHGVKIIGETELSELMK
jgi:DNA ligase (NAD+)